MSIFKNNFVVGFTAAVAATVLAPVLIPAIKRGSRPFAKSLVKGGIMLYEKGREAVASAGEMVEDVVAEVRAEAQEKEAAVMQQQSPADYARGEDFQPAARSGNGASGGASSPVFERGGSA